MNEIKLDGSVGKYVGALRVDPEHITRYGVDFLDRQRTQVKDYAIRELLKHIPDGVATTIKGEFSSTGRVDFVNGQPYIELRYEIQYAAVKEVRQEVRIITNSYRHLSDRVLTWTALKELKLRVRAWFRKMKPYMAD